MLEISYSLFSFSQSAVVVVVVQYVLRKRHNTEWCRLWFRPSFQSSWSLGPTKGLFSIPNLAISAGLRPSLSFLYVPLHIFPTPSSWMLLLLLTPDLSSAWLQPLEGPSLLALLTLHTPGMKEQREANYSVDRLSISSKERSKIRSCKMLATYECFIHRTACNVRSILKTEMLKKMLTAAKFMRRRSLHEWERIWRRKEQRNRWLRPERVT